MRRFLALFVVILLHFSPGYESSKNQEGNKHENRKSSGGSNTGPSTSAVEGSKGGICHYKRISTKHDSFDIRDGNKENIVQEERHRKNKSQDDLDSLLAKEINSTENKGKASKVHVRSAKKKKSVGSLEQVNLSTAANTTQNISKKSSKGHHRGISEPFQNRVVIETDTTSFAASSNRPFEEVGSKSVLGVKTKTSSKKEGKADVETKPTSKERKSRKDKGFDLNLIPPPEGGNKSSSGSSVDSNSSTMFKQLVCMVDECDPTWPRNNYLTAENIKNYINDPREDNFYGFIKQELRVPRMDLKDDEVLRKFISRDYMERRNHFRPIYLKRLLDIQILEMRYAVDAQIPFLFPRSEKFPHGPLTVCDNLFAQHPRICDSLPSNTMWIRKSRKSDGVYKRRKEDSLHPFQLERKRIEVEGLRCTAVLFNVDPEKMTGRPRYRTGKKIILNEFYLERGLDQFSFFVFEKPITEEKSENKKQSDLPILTNHVTYTKDKLLEFYKYPRVRPGEGMELFWKIKKDRRKIYEKLYSALNDPIEK